GQLVLWKLPEMKALYRLPTGSKSIPALSPGRKYVVVQTGNRFVMLDARTGSAAGDLLIPLEPIAGAHIPPAFSSDGARLAGLVLDIGGLFLLTYDLQTGKE